MRGEFADAGNGFEHEHLFGGGGGEGHGASLFNRPPS
jgi:hypothetical protein